MLNNSKYCKLMYIRSIQMKIVDHTSFVKIKAIDDLRNLYWT